MDPCFSRFKNPQQSCVHNFPLPKSQRMLSPVLLILLSYLSLVNSQHQSNGHTSQGKNIFLLVGQSNMAGRGGVVNNRWDGFVPPECRPNELILQLSAGLTWEEAREPLHQDIDVERTCGIGPGMAFSNTILQRDLALGMIGLVPCAVGGTNINEWQRGSDLYDQMLRRAQAAVHVGGGHIRALLWYQGESDTVNLEDAELYKGRLEDFLADVRSDLMMPFLPVILVALATGEGPYVEMVRKAQLGIALPNVRCVDAKGLELEPDGLHLSTAAQVRLGGMLANAFFQITLPPLPVQRGGAAGMSYMFFLDLLLAFFFLHTQL